jgi:hypothetical protein
MNDTTIRLWDENSWITKFVALLLKEIKTSGWTDSFTLFPELSFPSAQLN